MQSNKTINNSLYDQFLLEKTFNSAEMKNLARSEVNWVIEQAQITKETKILDVACGSGRHLMSFVEFGFLPFGVDYSSECVKLAKLNCPTISANIFEDDFKLFGQKQKSKFDVVLLAGASLGYGPTENEALEYLKHLAEILDNRGLLFIQFINKTWAEDTFKRPTSFWNETDEHFILDKRNIFDCKLKSEKIFISKMTGEIKRYVDSVYLFSGVELIAAAKNVDQGLKEFTLYNGFSDEKFKEKTSAMPVLLIRK